MSYHTGFSLFVFALGDPKAAINLPNISRVLDPGTAETEPGELAHLSKYLIGQTRSNWLKDRLKDLLDAAGGLEILRFLSEESFTHREFNTWDTGPLEDKSGGCDYQHTVIPRDSYREVVEAIDWLFLWCKNNHTLVDRLVDDAEENVLDSLYRVIESPEDEELKADEGQGVQFLFCVLKCVRNLLIHAHQHGLCAIYSNDQYLDFAYWKQLTALADGTQRIDGGIYANPDYRVPPAANRPILLSPPTGKPIDVAARLAAGTQAEREQAQMIRPYWVEGDDLAKLFEQEELLLQTGRVVWAALIQVNELLFVPQYRLGAPGEVVYDPAGRMSPKGLAEQARFLFKMKGKQRERPEEQFIADYLANEWVRVFGLDYPRNWCYYPLQISTTYFDQLHLPDGMLSMPYLPILISELCPGAVKVLPSQYWPEDFKEEWMQASQKKHGQRYDAQQLRADAQTKIDAMQKEYAQDPAPFNVIPASLYEEGLLYFHGRGVSQDYDLARRLWEKAAKLGQHSESMNNLGIIYAQGLGVKADWLTAYHWYRRAAEQGYVLGQLNLGKLHLQTDGGCHDRAKARYWLDLAAGQGNREAEQLLTDYRLYEDTDKPGLLGRILGKWFH
jgi:hypothetical protein